MENYTIYQDIAIRTDGDIYIGVVGPVRTGKSTFIKKFMEQLVLPNIENEYKRERALDELPQSAAGRTIMTTEPKFIPNEAVKIRLGDNADFNVRMIDCVGYIVPAALGYIEDNAPRMVMTPWFDRQIPFNQAAEIGTKKVIDEHSTIGLVVTTDGSICEIDREDYVEAEERVIADLKKINKPFVLILNSAYPQSEQTERLRCDLERKHNVQCLAVNCLQMSESDIKRIIESVLFEFPVAEIGIMMPSWFDALDNAHWLKTSMFDTVGAAFQAKRRVYEIPDAISMVSDSDYILEARIDSIKLGTGSVIATVRFKDEMFYKIISEHSGLAITNDGQLMSLIKELSVVKVRYEKVANALEEVNAKGYGIVKPSIDELKLEEPEIVKHGNRFGVKLKASAPSIHMIKANIETEVSPIVGSEKQSEELVHYMLSEFDSDPIKIWQSNIFGKSLHELVNEGLNNKLSKMPDDAQMKLQETLQKIINEGSGGLICIIL